MGRWLGGLLLLRQFFWRLAILLFLLLASRSVQPVHAEGLNRWAILADEPLVNMGLPELLSVELAATPHIELLARDAELLTRELELSALLSADRTTARLRLGEGLRADAILFLLIEERHQKRSVKMIVSESHFGARLRVTYVPLEDRSLEQVAADCAALVSEVREQYANGLDHLLAVPPLLSRNLSYEFDAYQVGYAQLLEQALLETPGAAVLEIEEARAIQRELSQGGTELSDEAALSVVTGDFEMMKKQDELLVHLRFRVVDGKQQTRDIIPEPLPLAEVPQYLVERLAAQLLGRRSGSTPLAQFEQGKLLAARADQFGGLGIWERSTELREAVLLLQPGMSDQRIALVYERSVLSSEQCQSEDQQLRALDNDEAAYTEYWKTARARRMEDWRIRRQHVEWLIRRRELNPREASYLVSDIMSFRRSLPSEQEVLKEADQFFWEMFALIPQLDPSIARGVVRRGTEGGFDLVNLRPEKWSPEFQLKRWTTEGIRILLDGHHYWIASLSERYPRDAAAVARQQLHDNLYRFFTTIVPSDAAPDWLFFSGSGFKQEDEPLFKRLADADHKGASIFGHYWLLKLAAERPDREPDAQLLAAIGALRDQVRQVDAPLLREYGNPVEGLYQRVNERLSRMGRIVRKPRHLPDLEPYPRDTLRRLTFTDVGLNTEDWLSLEACGKFDLAVSDERVLIIRARDQIDILWEPQKIVPGDKYIYDARWDGRWVWIALTEGGILVVEPDGRHVCRFDAQRQLPPYRETREREPAEYLHVHPCEPGRAIVVGALGRNDRVWFALIDARPNATESVQVFHRLDQLRGERSDVARIADIAWLKPLQLTGQSPGLLVRRGGSSDPPFPLLLNPQTLEVSVHPVPFHLSLESFERSRTRTRFCILADGTVLHPVGFGVEQFSLHKGNDWRHPPKLFIKNEMLIDEGWLDEGNRIIYAGGTWHQIDKATRILRPLTNGAVPFDCQFTHLARSAHYGLVGWKRNGPLVKISIDEPTNDLPAYHGYSQVPPVHRRQHLLADQQLSNAGAIVGPEHVRELPLEPTSIPRTEFVPTSHVVVPSGWRGPGTKLRHLNKLFDLKVLEFRKASVTDDDLQQLPALPKLEQLTLYETEVTDRGLAALVPENFPGLKKLRVESAQGQETFTDAALATVVNYPGLEELILSGAFTDAGLEALQGLPKSCHLRLNGTRFTREGLAALKFKRPDLSWQEE